MPCRYYTLHSANLTRRQDNLTRRLYTLTRAHYKLTRRHYNVSKRYSNLKTNTLQYLSKGHYNVTKLHSKVASNALQFGRSTTSQRNTLNNWSWPSRLHHILTIKPSHAISPVDCIRIPKHQGIINHTLDTSTTEPCIHWACFHLHSGSLNRFQHWM